MVLIENKEIKVAVAEFPPLVEKKGKKYSGFEVDLWEKIAQDAKIKYSYIQVPFQKIFSTIQSGKADIGFAGATMNEEREKIIDFSHSTFDSGLSILVQSSQKVSIFNTIKTVFNKDIKKILLTLLGFVLIIGHIIWLIEKGSAFSSAYFPGIIEALWWGMVTVSTVGYGDFSPITIVGRIVGAIVILLGLAIFGLYIAKVSSLMTVKSLRNKIESPEDLKDKKVATKSKTTSEEFLKELGVKVFAFPEISQAFEKLEKGEVDAVVFDSPVLLHYVKQKKDSKTMITGKMFDNQKYGFIIKEGDKIKEKINREILKLREDGFYKKLYKKYF